MKKIIIFLCFALILPMIYADTVYNCLIKSYADTLYCQQNGVCNLTQLNVNNVTVYNISIIPGYNKTAELSNYFLYTNGSNAVSPLAFPVDSLSTNQFILTKDGSDYPLLQSTNTILSIAGTSMGSPFLMWYFDPTNQIFYSDYYHFGTLGNDYFGRDSFLGSYFNEQLNMKNYKIVSLADPTDAQDAVTLNYLNSKDYENGSQVNSTIDSKLLGNIWYITTNYTQSGSTQGFLNATWNYANYDSKAYNLSESAGVPLIWVGSTDANATSSINKLCIRYKANGNSFSLSLNDSSYWENYYTFSPIAAYPSFEKICVDITDAFEHIMNNKITIKIESVGTPYIGANKLEIDAMYFSSSFTTGAAGEPLFSSWYSQLDLSTHSMIYSDTSGELTALPPLEVYFNSSTNLVSNPNFDTGIANWTSTSTAFTWVSGMLRAIGYLTTSFVVNGYTNLSGSGFYNMTYTITNVTKCAYTSNCDAAKLQYSSSATNYGNCYLVSGTEDISIQNGTYNQIWFCPSTTHLSAMFSVYPYYGRAYSIDNVSITKIETGNTTWYTDTIKLKKLDVYDNLTFQGQQVLRTVDMAIQRVNYSTYSGTASTSAYATVAGTVAPAGNDMDVQHNQAGTLAGNNLEWDYSNNYLYINFATDGDGLYYNSETGVSPTGNMGYMKSYHHNSYYDVFNGLEFGAGDDGAGNVYTIQSIFSKYTDSYGNTITSPHERAGTADQYVMTVNTAPDESSDGNSIFGIGPGYYHVPWLYINSPQSLYNYGAQYDSAVVIGGADYVGDYTIAVDTYLDSPETYVNNIIALSSNDGALCRDGGRISINVGATDCSLSSTKYKQDITTVTESRIDKIMRLRDTFFKWNNTAVGYWKTNYSLDKKRYDELKLEQTRFINENRLTDADILEASKKTYSQIVQIIDVEVNGTSILAEMKSKNSQAKIDINEILKTTPNSSLVVKEQIISKEYINGSLSEFLIKERNDLLKENNLSDIQIIEQAKIATEVFIQGTMTDREQEGFIAQEVYEVLPQCVNLNDKGEPHNINVYCLIGAITKGIQEQQEQINKINERLDAAGIKS